MTFMKGPGFPDPLFENIEELDEIAEAGVGSVIDYLLFKADIGPLRVADPVLGDLTVMAREAVARVQARIQELRTGEGVGGVPLE